MMGTMFIMANRRIKHFPSPYQFCLGICTLHLERSKDTFQTRAMATAINRLGCIALRDTSRIPVRRKCISSTHYVRQFHTSPLHRDEETKKPVESTPSSFNRFRHELDSKDRKFYDSLTPDEQQQWEEEDKKAHEYMTSPAIESELQGIASRAANEANDESPHVQINIPKIKPGLMAMGEEDEQDSGEDEEYEGDDITSLGHANLEQHREMREYARIMAWEMPLLSSLSSPTNPLPPLSSTISLTPLSSPQN